MSGLSPALKGLEQYRQFIIHQNKVPTAIDGTTRIDPHNPAVWTDYETAKRTADLFGQNYGVGFVFTPHDPFWFLDIDHCLEPNGTGWSALATDLCHRFQGAAIELSVSGTGLHIFGTGQAPNHSSKNKEHGIEFYTERRFAALTDLNTVGDCLTDHSGAVGQLVSQYFPPRAAVTVEGWRTEAVPEWNGPDDDETLINKARSSRSGAAAFGRKASFDDLWTGNAEVLTGIYPSLNDHDPYDRSSADAALAQHLAFWTGKNHERIERLMRQSALMRPKWDAHKSYLGEMTITRAISNQKDVYSSGPARVEVESVGVVMTPKKRSGIQFMSTDQLIEYFKDCIYIRDIQGILVPDGSILKPDQFKSHFGGYEFSVTDDNSRTTRNAWEAFTENQAVDFPKVVGVCFRPELPAYNILIEDGRAMVNTYVPVETRRVKGDPTPFLDLLARLLPIERDRNILLSWMAAGVQNPGKKFQWSPLLQGVEGNGKTLLINVMEQAIGRRYTHLPNADDLGGNGLTFNKWIMGNLFIGVEEIYVSDRREVTEALKVPITNSRLEVQGKGADQITGDNRTIWMLCTNHKDAMKITFDTRRYAVFYTAQQSKADLVRDGMAGRYFPDLYKWFEADGYAIVNDYLREYVPVDEFNPADGCQIAPHTSSTVEAVELSMGGIEQEVLEQIEQDAPGFAKGWVSSMALNKLLVRMKADYKIPRNKRRGLMQSLGYDYHPNLPAGRVNNAIPAEGGKPKLFIKNGHLATNLVSVAEIERRYKDDQNYPSLFGNVVTSQ